MPVGLVGLGPATASWQLVSRGLAKHTQVKAIGADIGPRLALHSGPVNHGRSGSGATGTGRYGWRGGVRGQLFLEPWGWNAIAAEDGLGGRR